MSYTMLKKPVALAGMDPIACLSRGGMPMPTPVPWGGVDIDCQLPGEPPQAASCRSYGGMWYRELGLCIPGTIPGGIPSFPATPYAPPPPANPYDQVAAQVCTATGGRYAGGICNYPQLGVTRTRSQLVDSEYEPPAGWTPPAGGCPQGQIGWPPACVPVPNTLPSIPTTPGSCPAGTTWDAASGKCIAPAQLPPPGESESEKQVAPAAPAEEKKLPSWVLPAVAGGAAFVILAALVASQRRSMRANAGAPSQELVRLALRAGVAGAAADRAPRNLNEEQLAELYSRAGSAHADAADLARKEGQDDMAVRHENAWQRYSKRAAFLRFEALRFGAAPPTSPEFWRSNRRRMRLNCEMRANAGAPSKELMELLDRARRASLAAHRPPPGYNKAQLAELHFVAGRAHADAGSLAWKEGQKDIARRHDAAWERHGKRGQELRDLYYAEHSVSMPWERNARRMRQK